MVGKHGEPGMKRITFYGYAENCNCTYCTALREIMERDTKAQINSFTVEEDNRMQFKSAESNHVKEE